jgi:hypothetical protein
MHRRALLVAVAGLSGCTSLVGGGSDAPGESGGSGTDDATGDDDAGDGTPTPGTATPSPTPTEETPSAAELRRMSVSDLLALARSELAAAVAAYADAGGGDALTAVTAATEGFDAGVVVDHLYGAQRAYEAADRQGLAADQETEISRLGRVQTLLRLSIDTQVLLIEAHDDLEGVVTAVRYLDPETASSLADRAGTRRGRAADAVSELSTTRYEQSVRAVDGLSPEGYVDKRDQFRAETEVLDELREALSSVVEGVRLFARAKGRRTSGAPYAAASLGQDAESAFAAGAADLDAVAAGIPPDGRGFDGVAASLLAVTEEQRAAARAFHEEIDPEA